MPPTRNCIIKKIWEKSTPYVQIGGFLIMMGTIISGLFICFSFINKTNDAMASVTELLLFKDETKTSIAVMKQEIHDMHEWLKP